VSQCGLPVYIKKYLNTKEESGKLKNISPCKNIIIQKSSKGNQNPSRYYNSCNLSQVSTRAKISSFKHPHIKINRPIITYLGARIPEATILYDEPKHNILRALVGQANK
jgi:hypothetical protein